MSNKTKKLVFVFVLALLLASVVSVSLTWAAGETSIPPSIYTVALAAPRQEVRLQQTSSLTINDIAGATYDPATGELIVIGQVLDNPDLPVMDYDYVKENLVVALRALHSAPESPAVTIDPIPGDPNADHHEVKFFGNITNTHYGYVFFESDRLLKTYGLGRDNLSINDPFSSNVPNYISFFDRWLALHDTSEDDVSVRWWFTPSLHLRTDSTTTQTILFSNTQVILNWELMGGTSTPEMISAANDFRTHFNSHYSQFAAEQQARFDNNALAELPQLYKLYGIAYWSSAEDKVALNVHGANGGWLGHYPLTSTTTPLTTPVISRSETFEEGGTIYSFVLVGGVGTNPPLSQVADPLAELTGPKLLQDRPNLQTRSWYSNLPGGISPSGVDAAADTPVIAMAFDLSDNLIQDSSFEDGPDSPYWVQNPGGAWDLIWEGAGYRGNYGVYLGDVEYVNENIYQQVTIPAAATHPRLSYYWVMFTTESLCLTSMAANESISPPFVTVNLPQVVSPPPHRRSASTIGVSDNEDISIAAAYDFLYVEILDTNNNVLKTLQTISNDDTCNQWQLSSFSLEGYQGQTIRIRFRATNDSSNPTGFWVDDVSLDIDPLISQTSPTDIYLPIIIKPALTDLYIQNNVGKTLNLTINGVGSRSIQPSAPGSPYHWGTFPAGTYSWVAKASGFASDSGTDTFPPGRVDWTFGVGSSAASANNNSETSSDQMLILEY